MLRSTARDLAVSHGGAELDLTLNEAKTTGSSVGTRRPTPRRRNYVNDGSFAGATGFSTVVQNSGNNVLIQNATVINLKVMMPNPRSGLSAFSVAVGASALWLPPGVCRSSGAGGRFLLGACRQHGKEQRFQKTLHQQYDFSCGSLRWPPCSPTITTSRSLSRTSSADVCPRRSGEDQKEGFSCLTSRTTSPTTASMPTATSPSWTSSPPEGAAIVLIKEQGYFHFVVVKGLRDGPGSHRRSVFGHARHFKEQVREIWANNIPFVIKNKLETGPVQRRPATGRPLPASPIAAATIAVAPTTTSPNAGLRISEEMAMIFSAYNSPVCSSPAAWPCPSTSRPAAWKPDFGNIIQTAGAGGDDGKTLPA